MNTYTFSIKTPQGHCSRAAHLNWTAYADTKAAAWDALANQIAGKGTGATHAFPEQSGSGYPLTKTTLDQWTLARILETLSEEAPAGLRSQKRTFRVRCQSIYTVEATSKDEAIKIAKAFNELGCEAASYTCD